MPVNFRKVLDIKLKKQPDLLSPAELEFLQKPLNVKVLFAIRDDRMSQMKQLADFLPDILRIMYELKPLTREQARKAITEPAGKLGEFTTEPFSFTSDAVEHVLNYLSAGNMQTIETT